jgi:hypothetical protein
VIGPIAFMSVCGAAAFFMLEFLCALLREARRPRIGSLRDVRGAVALGITQSFRLMPVCPTSCFVELVIDNCATDRSLRPS